MVSDMTPPPPVRALHVRPRDIRGLRPVAAEHHRHAPLRVVAGGIVVAADLLARRHIERIVEGERRQAGVLDTQKLYSAESTDALNRLLSRNVRREVCASCDRWIVPS
jgi:hypothetical protein